MNKKQQQSQEQLRGIAEYFPIPDDFKLENISWVPTDSGCEVGITSVYGVPQARKEGHFVINVADEITSAAHAFIPIEADDGWNSENPEEFIQDQRETVHLIASLIEGMLTCSDRKVVVHCHMGMERSVLAVAWWLHFYKGMTLDKAYEVISKARPIALDRRNWIGEAHCDEDEIFSYA